MFSLKVQTDEVERIPVSDDLHVCDTLDQISGASASGRIEFTAGNPRVESLGGSIRLFRDVSQPPLRGSAGSSCEIVGTSADDSILPENRSPDVCLLAVPKHLPISELCAFLSGLLSHVRNMRIVRDSASKSWYTVLITFDTQESADDCYLSLGGRQFNSMEPEVCRVLFVQEVEFASASDARSAAGSGPKSISGTELPYCPVCLDRLDQHISGVVTTVCNHSFHCTCLSQWADTSCPVCRYILAPTETPVCQECGTDESLWMCIICGYVGCGRYHQGHAREHWANTDHCYCLELKTQRVWDYVGDGYVHRLVQSSTDGKVVELSDPNPFASVGRRLEGSHSDLESDTGDPDKQHAVVASKLDAMAFEYNQLLTQTLESQRYYYEDLLTAAATENAHLQEVLDATEDSKKAARDAIGHAKEMELKAVKAEKKHHDVQAKLMRTAEEKEFLRQVNESLITNQKQLQIKLKDQQAQAEASNSKNIQQIQELEDQVRDLMVFIETQNKLANTSSAEAEDLRNGTVMTVASPCPVPSPDTRESLRAALKEKRRSRP